MDIIVVLLVQLNSSFPIVYVFDHIYYINHMSTVYDMKIILLISCLIIKSLKNVFASHSGFNLTNSTLDGQVGTYTVSIPFGVFVSKQLMMNVKQVVVILFG